jgi:ABC-type multidrug transport system permease subunit
VKIGPERTPLSERLSAAAIEEATASQAVEERASALLDSILMNFKTVCEHSSTAALSIIEADMANLVLGNRRAISGLSVTMRADLNLIRQLTRFAPWSIAISLILLIVTSLGLSWWWAQSMISGAEKIALQRIGITSVQTPSGAILLIDNSKLTLTTCQVQGQPIACLTTPAAR